MKEQFQYWYSEIARIEAGGDPLDMNRQSLEPAPIAGYWRVLARRTGHDWPVLIQRGDGQELYTIQWGGGRPKVMTAAEADEFAAGTFLNCRAVRRLDWTAAVERGKWPDDGKDSIPKTDAEKLGIDENPPALTPAEQGGNAPPEAESDDPVWDQIRAKLLAELGKVATLGTVDTLEKANEAAAIRDTIMSLGKMGEKRRKDEKEPWDAGAAVVQAKYVPTLKPASEAAANLLVAIDRFQRAEQKRMEDEERARQQVEQKRIAEIEAQRIRDEAAARAREAEANAEPAPPAPTEEEIVERANVAAAEKIAEQPPVEISKPVVQGSAFSRATTKATTHKGKIVDALAFVTSLIEAGDSDLMEFLQKRANAAARAKIKVPGVEFAND
jgi:hypothetical protein